MGRPDRAAGRRPCERFAFEGSLSRSTICLAAQSASGGAAHRRRPKKHMTGRCAVARLRSETFRDHVFMITPRERGVSTTKTPRE